MRYLAPRKDTGASTRKSAKERKSSFHVRGRRNRNAPAARRPLPIHRIPDSRSEATPPTACHNLYLRMRRASLR